MHTTTTHDHSLDGIVGYQVRQTIVDGVTKGLDGPIVATFDRDNLFGQACERARELTQAGPSGRLHDYAVVDNVYGCGCTCRDL